MRSRAPAWRRPRPLSLRGKPASRSRLPCSTATARLVGHAPFAPAHRRASRGSGGDSRRRRARCRGNPPPPARGRPGSAPCARSARPRPWRRCRPSVPRTMRSSGQLAPARRPRPGNRRHRTASSSATTSSSAWMARWMASVAPVAAKAASVSPSGMREARPDDARQHHALRHLGHGQLAAERRGGGGEGRHARRQRVGNAAPLEPAQLLGERAVDREVARMQARHVLAGRVRRDELGLDLVERHRRGVDDARAGRAMREQARAARSSRHRGRPGSGRSDRVRAP